MKYLTLAAATLLATSASAEPPQLVVYTYDSFVADWGPGPVIEAAFEAECDCDLKFVGMGDGAALLARLKLEGARSDADVVLGLDTSLVAAAKDTGLFAPAKVTADYDLPVTWADDTFVPYDWGVLRLCPRQKAHRAQEFPRACRQRPKDRDSGSAFLHPRSGLVDVGQGRLR